MITPTDQLACNEPSAVEESKTVDEKTLQNLFREFNSETFKFYRNQNGISNGYLDFLEEKDADNFVEVCNNMTLGNRAIQLKKESLY